MKGTSILFEAGAAILLFALASGCSGNDAVVASIPTVVSTVPADQSTDVPINAGVSAVFSERMNQASVNTTTVTLVVADTGAAVAGTVLYTNFTAAFWPTARLDSNTAYTAMVHTGAESTAGIGLMANRSWQFTTGIVVGPVNSVDLGMSGNFAVLAKAAISTVPTSAITGDLGISPAAASFVTGFGLTLDASNQFSTSPQVIGRVFAADYAPPTPADLTTAVLDMQAAFADAAARAPDVTELGAGSIGGLDLAPGVYKWGTGLLIPTDVTLTGSGTDVWIFQIAQDLVVSSAVTVILAGGAVASNVFWQVSGLVDLGTTSSFEGSVLCATAITMRTGSSIHGRLLAQTAVSVDAATITKPVQ